MHSHFIVSVPKKHLYNMSPASKISSLQNDSWKNVVNLTGSDHNLSIFAKISFSTYGWATTPRPLHHHYTCTLSFLPQGLAPGHQLPHQPSRYHASMMSSHDTLGSLVLSGWFCNKATFLASCNILVVNLLPLGIFSTSRAWASLLAIGAASSEVNRVTL